MTRRAADRWIFEECTTAFGTGGIDGECGRLVGPDDVEALAASLVELGRDPGLRRKLGDAAQERAEAFSTVVADEKLLALYEALVRNKRLA